jgi:hypothetical protein
MGGLGRFPITIRLFFLILIAELIEVAKIVAANEFGRPVFEVRVFHADWRHVSLYEADKMRRLYG